ncbi:hypothetical protein AKO1_014608 [Acrasis kona]|uniref:ABC transporter domain-containing protein n=1 Tax=Acrasis kona TaxID=1008807 RepID=A0AAW2Z2Q9_9EUKA
MKTPGIIMSNVCLSFEKKLLFDDLDFSLLIGDKVTIVGENGCGKTTLLRLLSGADYFYSGSIEKEGRIGYLPQHFEELDGDEPAIITILRFLESPEIQTFLKQPFEPLSPEWYQELNSLGGHDIFRQANLIGLSNSLLEQPFKLLSGGEKTKSMLCALSIMELDIILLDEPTNHLDAQGIQWLESYLKNFEGSVVMVTHDRSIINAVSNRISELSPHSKKFVHFKGGYDHYLEQEEKKRQRLIQERQLQEKELKTLKQKSIQLRGKMKDRKMRDESDRDKLSYNNQEHRVQKGTTKAYNQLTRKQEHLTDALVEVIPERSKISFGFEQEETVSSCIQVENISKTFSEQPLFQDISFTLVSGDVLVVQGPNGSGKSTLMNILMDQIKADQGEVSINGVVGYLDQEQENLPLEKSAVQLLMEDPLINATKSHAIYRLSHFGIYTWHDLKSPLKELSVGCRRKAQLCQMIMRKSTILLLDEPTNHIDFPSLEVIEEALLDFPGIIIAATHDRYFTEKFGERILNLSDYKANLSE